MPVYMGGDGPYLAIAQSGRQQQTVTSGQALNRKGSAGKDGRGCEGEAVRHPGHVVHAPFQGRGIGNRR